MQQRAKKADSAEQDLALAHNEYSRRLAVVESTKQRLEEALDVTEEKEEVLGVEHLFFYRVSLRTKISAQEREAKIAGRRVEYKRNQAVQARRERLVMETLKDKCLANYKFEADAKEQKEVDEMALYAYQRRLHNF